MLAACVAMLRGLGLQARVQVSHLGQPGQASLAFWKLHQK